MVLRVYTFSEDIVWYLRHIRKYSMEEISKFYRCDYRVRLSIDVSRCTASLRRLTGCSVAFENEIGYVVNTDEVIEMDDGQRPVFFYVQKDRLRQIQIENLCDGKGNRTLFYDGASLCRQLGGSPVDSRKTVG